MTPLARSAIVDRMRVFHGRALVVGYAALATACSTPFGAPAPIAEPSLADVERPDPSPEVVVDSFDAVR